MTDLCPHCGAPDLGTPFCDACGARLREAPPAPVGESAPPSPSPGGTAQPISIPSAYFERALPGELASIPRRFAAQALDEIAITLTAIFLTLLATGAFRLGAGELPETYWDNAFFFWVFVNSLLLGAAYHTTFIGAGGKTPGKGVLGIRVASADGTRLGYGRAFLRAVGYAVSWAFFGLGFLWALWDRKRQAWHDKIAGTVVVKSGP